MTITSGDQLNEKHPDIGKVWDNIEADIEAAPEDAPREFVVDPKLIGIGAVPSRINGKSASEE